MRISTATIDCWLQVGIQFSGDYFDFEHHHWDIGPSSLIDSGATNHPIYTWTLFGFGNDANGSWTMAGQSNNLQATVRTLSLTSTTVSLTNPIFGTNSLPAIGNTAVQHPVDELTWPTTLTWSLNLATPGSVIYSDANPPFYQRVFIPFNIGSVVRGRGDVGGMFQVDFVFPGTGGQDWTHKTQFFQKPGNVTARAWWAWTINLV